MGFMANEWLSAFSLPLLLSSVLLVLGLSLLLYINLRREVRMKLRETIGRFKNRHDQKEPMSFAEWNQYESEMHRFVSEEMAYIEYQRYKRSATAAWWQFWW